MSAIKLADVAAEVDQMSQRIRAIRAENWTPDWAIQLAELQIGLDRFLLAHYRNRAELEAGGHGEHS